MKGKLDGFASATKKSLGDLDKKFGSVHGGIKKVAAATAAIGTVGGLAAFSIVKAGADFEEAITAVGAVSLETRDQIAALERKALELGATTKFTATQAANAMQTMKMAGFTNADVLAGVGPILDAAAASGLEIAEVANHVSNALKGMGLETSEAARVADVLAVASARTNSSIGSLGESLSNVASTARKYSIPLEEVVAGVALLQDVGLDASVAGSALNTMLTQMATPTDAIAEKMKKWGVSFKDANGNMLPFQEVLANISKASKKAGGNMDQVAFIAELVGLRGQKAAANLADLFDTGRVQALTKELENAEGAARKMAAIRMNNLKGDFVLLDSAIDGVKVALFNTQSGPLREIIQSMTKWVETNRGLIIFEFQVWLRRITNNFEKIVGWLKAIGVAALVFYSLWAAVKVAELAIAAYEIATKLATAATWLWGKSVAAYNLISKVNVAAIGTQVAAMGPLLVTLGAAAVAVGALIAVWDQYNKLDKDLEGSGGVTGTIGKMWKMGTWDPFEAHDAVMNEKAKVDRKDRDRQERETKDKKDYAASAVPGLPQFGVESDAFMADLLAKSRLDFDKLDRDFARDRQSVHRDGWGPSTREQPQIISPQARAAVESAEVNAEVKMDGKLTVEALPGTRVTVKQKPTKVPLTVKPSGAFAT